jgi:hypothetical protein
MARPSEGRRRIGADADRSWSSRDHAVFVATVALGALLPPAVALGRGADAWPWVALAGAATWFVERSRRAGGVTGVTTPGGKRFLYAAFWFYVTATAMVGAVVLLVGAGATRDPVMIANVLAPAGAVGAGTWVRLSPADE